MTKDIGHIGSLTSFSKLNLAAPHSTIVTVLGSMQFAGNPRLDQHNLSSTMALALVAGKGLVPPAERDSVIGAFAGVRDRIIIVQGTASDKAPYAEAVTAISSAVTLLKKQPDHPPSATNGKAEELPNGGFMATKSGGKPENRRGAN